MDLAAMRGQIEALEGELERIRAGHAQLQRKLEELQVTVTSADGLVTATVDARGRVTQVQVDPRIYQRPDSRLLSATITATIQQAAEEAVRQVAELLRPFVPDEVREAMSSLDLDRVLEARESALMGR